jgi:hypothetical protein
MVIGNDFLLGIDVMEVQVDDAAVVAAYRAAAAGFLNQHALQPLLPSSHCLPDAALATPGIAAPRSAAVLGELGNAVTVAAAHFHRPLAPRVRRSAALINQGNRGLQVRVQLTTAWHTDILATLDDEMPANRA